MSVLDILIKYLRKRRTLIHDHISRVIGHHVKKNCCLAKSLIGMALPYLNGVLIPKAKYMKMRDGDAKKSHVES